MRMSKQYEERYVELLGEVSQNTRLGHEELTGFWPMRGANYTGELLVLGRCVNGWDTTPWTGTDARTPAGRRAITARTRAMSEEYDDPIADWIVTLEGSHYSTNRSAFLRTARRVCRDVVPRAEDQWASHLAWSNVTKIAPHEGGNASNKLWQVQRTHAVELLRQELEELKPRRVLALTGRDWLDRIGPELGVKIRWRRVRRVALDRGSFDEGVE